MNFNELPNIMYFGASKQIIELKGSVFLTPHIGIASLFIIDIDNGLFPVGYETNCNIGYRQWNWSNDLLAEPLKIVNVTHNIPTLEDKSFKGLSSGYIHVVDISNVKDKLSLFATNDPDREVIYNGEEPLTIIKFIPHTLNWDFNFCQEDLKRHGVGTAKKIT
ncbi:MAG: hypothetical protein FWG68_01550 [Defluviitaleaceae bacterium]|nr:hypothetical protein [Defluviitaleaceae bacterium]